MERVQPPKRGSRIRYDRGRFDGVFVIDGKRTFRLLELVKDAERTPAGRLRSEQQISDYMLKRWDHKCAEMEAELAEHHGDGLTMSGALEKWEEWAKTEGLAQTTIDLHYKVALTNYQAANGDHPIAEVSLAHLDRFKKHLRDGKLAPATINLRLAKVAALLRWAQRRDYIEKIPWIEPVRETRLLARPMEAKDIRRLIERLRTLIQETKHKWHKYYYELHELLLVLNLATGMRRGEPFQCTWAEVDLKAGTLRIPHPKEGDEKLVALPPIAVNYLKRRRRKYGDHVRLFDDGKGGSAYTDAHALTTAFRRHLKKLGLAGQGIKPLHTYRATFSTIGLDLLGLEPIAVQAQLGHSSLKTTQRSYVATMVTAKRKAVGTYERRYLRALFDRKPSESKPSIAKKAARSK